MEKVECGRHFAGCKLFGRWKEDSQTGFDPFYYLRELGVGCLVFGLGEGDWAWCNKGLAWLVCLDWIIKGFGLFV